MIDNFEGGINPPMPDSKSAQSWYFFSILQIDNFLGFQNVFPKLHDQLNDCRFGTTILRHGLQFLVNLQVEDFPSTIQS